MRDQDLISLSRVAATDLWAAINKLRALRKEIDARGGASTLPEGDGANTGVTAAQVGAVTGTTLDGLESFLASGNATNLTKLL